MQSLSAVILEPKKIKSVTVSIVFPSICYEMMGPDAMILVFWMLSFKPTFSLSSFTFLKRLFSSSLSSIRVVSSAYPRLLIFLLAILIPACVSSSPVFLMILIKIRSLGFPGGSVVKNLLANARDKGWVPGWGRSHMSWATKPVCHDCWACALEPGNHSHWAQGLQLAKSVCPRARVPQQKKPPWWEAWAPQPERNPSSKKDPAQPEINDK